MTSSLEKPTAINVSTAKIGVIINTSSGSCDLESELEMLNILAAHNVKHPLMWCDGSDGMKKAFEESQKEKLDILIVLGGDGTIRKAAEMVTANGPLLIVLPGGTMNLLPKALYSERPWQEVLKATLKAPYIRSISGGKVGSDYFFIAAIIGGPSLFAEAREAIRKGEILPALEKSKVALQQSQNTHVHYKIGTEEGDVETISIICPLISQELDEHIPFFEVIMVDVHTIGDVIALGSRAMFGKWRDDSHVSVIKTNRVQVSGYSPIPAILDGERTDLTAGIQIEFLPDAFTVLVPQEFHEHKYKSG